MSILDVVVLGDSILVAVNSGARGPKGEHLSVDKLHYPAASKVLLAMRGTVAVWARVVEEAQKAGGEFSVDSFARGGVELVLEKAKRAQERLHLDGIAYRAAEEQIVAAGWSQEHGQLEAINVVVRPAEGTGEVQRWGPGSTLTCPAQGFESERFVDLRGFVDLARRQSALLARDFPDQAAGGRLTLAQIFPDRCETIDAGLLH